MTKFVIYVAKGKRDGNETLFIYRVYIKQGLFLWKNHEESTKS